MCIRDSCECGSSGDPTIAQALHLLNAKEIEQKLQAPDGRVTALSLSSLGDADLINEISLSTIGRPPNSKELKIGIQLLLDKDRRQGIEDFMWVMLNSYDFLFVK